MEAAKDIASSCNQEGQLFEKEFMARFMALFEGDDDAQAILLALEEGQSKSEIMTGLDWNGKGIQHGGAACQRTRNVPRDNERDARWRRIRRLFKIAWRRKSTKLSRMPQSRDVRKEAEEAGRTLLLSVIA